MEIKCKFDHYCFVVFNLEESTAFYQKALGLSEKRRAESADGLAVRAYMGEDKTGFTVELTYFKNNDKPYNLGDNKGHIAVHVAENYGDIKKMHGDSGWIVREIPERNIHFIADPDGNVIEVMLVK